RAVAPRETYFHQRTRLAQRAIYHTRTAHLPRRRGHQRYAHARGHETDDRGHLNRLLLDPRRKPGIATKAHDEIVQPDARLAREKDEWLVRKRCKRHTPRPRPVRGQRCDQR